MGFKQYSPDEQQQILFEQKGQRVYPHCASHNYWGARSGVPAMGCKACASVDWVYKVFNMPPHKREEQMALAKELLSKMNELADKRKLDLVIGRPDIKVEKGKEN